jgi:hypothetical protein
MGRNLIVRATINTSRSIAEIMPRRIHVPLPAANVLQRFARHWRGSQIPRYTVRLAYGVHDEPWVDSVALKP